MDSATGWILRSERLGFRTWRQDDLALAWGLWGDVEVTKLFDARGPLSRDEVRTKLLEEVARQSEHGVQYWPMFLLGSLEHIGCAGLRPHDPAANVFEIGCHVRSAHWRNGYALEASRAIMRHAFATVGAAALFAGHHPENAGSRQLLQRLGFLYTHDAYYAPTGLEHPSYLMTAGRFQQLSDAGFEGT